VVRGAIENGEVVPPPQREDFEGPVHRPRRNHKDDLTKCRQNVKVSRFLHKARVNRICLDSACQEVEKK
jgi:hypothetical protein